MAAAVAACVGVQPWALEPAGCADALDAVVAAENQLAAVKLGLVRHIDAGGFAKEQGATSTAVWLRGRYRMAIGAARSLVELARAVFTGPAVFRNAVEAGDLNPEQIQTIAATLRRISRRIAAEAAERLVTEAAGGIRGRWPGWARSSWRASQPTPPTRRESPHSSGPRSANTPTAT